MSRVFGQIYTFSATFTTVSLASVRSQCVCVFFVFLVVQFAMFCFKLTNKQQKHNTYLFRRTRTQARTHGILKLAVGTRACMRVYHHHSPLRAADDTVSYFGCCECVSSECRCMRATVNTFCFALVVPFVQYKHACTHTHTHARAVMRARRVQNRWQTNHCACDS